MPIYEFSCDTCETITEHFLMIGEAHPETCPECGGKLTKIVSNMAFVLKGSGFHLNDYASPEKKKLMASEKTPPAPPAAPPVTPAPSNA